ncbi:hypothetical protein HDU99_002056, partial [Rhizoclosmatium hyalinum]
MSEVATTHRYLPAIVTVSVIACFGLGYVGYSSTLPSGTRMHLINSESALMKLPVSPKEWAEARASQMFKAWETAERMSPSEAATVGMIDVYSLFPETYSCDKNNFV